MARLTRDDTSSQADASSQADTSHQADASSQADALARLETFLSPYTGIVRRVHESFRTPEDARMSLLGCRMASGEATTGSTYELAAAGAAYRPDRARAAALGEAVERYAGTCLPRSGAVLATASEIGPGAVAPERWALFSEEQHAREDFPFHPFRDDTRVRWVRGWSIPDGAEVYLPLQLTYMVRPGQHAAGEAPIAYGSSNGMALATETDQAVLGGLLELIERDAVMLTWAGRLIQPRIDWSGEPRLAELERRHFRPTGVEYDVLDLSAFLGIPTAMALAPGRPLPGTRPDAVVWGIGAAAAPTMAEACDKALRECFQTRTSLRNDLLAGPEDRPEGSPDPLRILDPLDIETPEDHMHFYIQASRHPKLAFLTSSDRTRDVSDVPAVAGDDAAAQVREIARLLAVRGVSAYAADITPPDVAEAGLRVVHVLSPELQPLDFPHRFRFLGGRRLYHAAAEAGLVEQPFGPDDLNPDPHPFP